MPYEVSWPIKNKIRIWVHLQFQYAIKWLAELKVETHGQRCFWFLFDKLDKRWDRLHSKLNTLQDVDIPTTLHLLDLNSRLKYYMVNYMIYVINSSCILLLHAMSDSRLWQKFSICFALKSLITGIFSISLALSILLKSICGISEQNLFAFTCWTNS